MTLNDLQAIYSKPALEWPTRREVPCKDLDLDCFAFDGVIPFGDYGRCQQYDPDAGRCIFLNHSKKTPV